MTDRSRKAIALAGLTLALLGVFVGGRLSVEDPPSCYVSADGMPAPGCADQPEATLRDWLVTVAFLLLFLGSWLVVQHAMEPEDRGRIVPGWTPGPPR